jgi:mono/diheme cytochrome c family protein
VKGFINADFNGIFDPKTQKRMENSTTLYDTLFQIHRLVVSIFLALYFTKMVLLLMNKTGQLTNFRKWTKVPEMIVATTFLITGLWMIGITQTVSMSQIFKFVAIIAAIPCGVIGFVRGNKILGVLSFVLLVAAYGIAEMGKRIVRNDPVPVDLQTDPNADGYDIQSHGNMLYNKYCMNCHGRDGKQAGATDLTTSTLERQDIIELIRFGRGRMPNFQKKMNEQELEAVAAYAESLRVQNQD